MKSISQLDGALRVTQERRARARGIGLAVMCAVLFAWLLVPIGSALVQGDEAGTAAGVSIATLGGLALMGPLREKEGEGGGGGGGGAEGDVDDPLGKQILSKIADAQKAYEEITNKVAEIDKEGKQMSEEFAKAVKSFEGLGSDVRKVFETQKNLERKIANERAASYGSALDRITRNPELALYADSIVRGTIAAGCPNRGVAMHDEHKRMFKQFQDNAEAARKALTTGTSPGSTVIDDELITQFYSLIAEYGVWPIFDVIQAGTGTSKLITDDTDPVMGFVAENTANSETGVTGTTTSVTAKKAMGWLAVSNELLEDAEINIAAHLLPKFANAAALRADHIALAADGTDDASDGTYSGLFYGGTTSALESGETTIENADFEDYLDVLLSVDASVLSRATSRWFAHPQMLVRILGLKDSNGRPIFLPAIDAPSPGALGSILGYPVTLAHAAPNTNTASKPVLAFGDAKGQALLIRRAFTFAASEHFQFTSDNVVFRATTRMATKTRKATAFGVMTTAAS